MICDEITGRQKNAPPPQPRHTKYATIQGDDGEFDDAHTPCVDEDIGKGNLVWINFTRSNIEGLQSVQW